MPIKILKNIKEKKVVKAKAIKEAEQIFMKTNPKMAMKDGSFPKTSQHTPKAYNREAKRVQNQVKTRIKQMKDNHKKK